ncbi:hypothetical protein, partial [Paenibacillus sp. MMS18-CY102]|uniref:hypothetical protein n=1 Tax=Paenibacillus sp. MMS18-CY102 TaxID=2682849 RepID=UPI001F1CD60F
KYGLNMEPNISLPEHPIAIFTESHHSSKTRSIMCALFFSQKKGDNVRITIYLSITTLMLDS